MMAGSTYLDLLEAKWHADHIPASTLYQFKDKVEGEQIGTRGVFIAMSSYSEDASVAHNEGERDGVSMEAS